MRKNDVLKLLLRGYAVSAMATSAGCATSAPTTSSSHKPSAIPDIPFDKTNQEHVDALGFQYLGSELEEGKKPVRPWGLPNGLLLPLVDDNSYLISANGVGTRLTASFPFAQSPFNRSPEDRPNDQKLDHIHPAYRLDNILIKKDFGLLPAADAIENPDSPAARYLRAECLKSAYMKLLTETYNIKNPSKEIDISFQKMDFPVKLDGYSLTRARLEFAVEANNQTLERAKTLLGAVWSNPDANLEEKLAQDPEGFSFIPLDFELDETNNILYAHGLMVIYSVAGGEHF